MARPPDVLRDFYLIPLTKFRVSQENPHAPTSDIIAKTNQALSADRNRQLQTLRSEPSPLSSEISDQGISHLKKILKSSLTTGGEDRCQHCRLHGLKCDGQRPSCWKCQRFMLPCYYERDEEGCTLERSYQQTDSKDFSNGYDLSWEDSFRVNPYENLEREGRRHRATKNTRRSRKGRLTKPKPQGIVNQADLVEEFRLEKEYLLRSPSRSSVFSEQEHVSRAPSPERGHSRSSSLPCSREDSCISIHESSLITSSTQRTHSVRYTSTTKTTPPTTGDSVVSRLSETLSCTEFPLQHFQCTFCLEECEGQTEWEYHEELHLPRSLWICMPWGPVEDIDDYDTCVFCYALEPREEHDSEHAIQPCYDASMTDRTFASKSAFQRHLLTVHGQTRMNSIIHEWKFPVSDDSYYWNCGFCGTPESTDTSGFCNTLLSTWTERAEHIGEHFQSGMVMSSWDPYTPPFPLDRVTLTCAAWFPTLPWDARTLWDLERSRSIGIPYLQDYHQCQKCDDQISFKTENDRERHQFIWHTRREIWCCPTIQDIKRSLLAYHFFPDNLEFSSANRDVCCFCKDRFPQQQQYSSVSDAKLWELRLRHLQVYHHFGRCRPACSSHRYDL
ncbi:hypothetical protein BGZ60DRAFT_437913 [Tricladium varicosporioides]|nr:hypothetical protein BGZ60DRAFT_437913 [Hymenoscyphus varicosporioides]